MSTSIGQFRAILLGPTPIFFPPAHQLLRDAAVATVLGAIPAVDPIDPPPALLAAALTDLTTVGTNCVADAAITAVVTAWVADIRQALANIVPAAGAPPGYADNVLYIVTAHEFGLNGWQTVDGNSKWSAANPIPEALETSIVTAIQAMLTANFSHVRVLVALSSCSYAPAVVENVVDRSRRVSGSSKITVITTYGIQRILKIKPAESDEWANARYLDSNSLGSVATARPNIAQIQSILNFPHDVYNAATRPVLGFGTCLDINTDVHGDVNLCIYLGSGAPNHTLRDTAHPFLLNDEFGWRGDQRAMMRSPGYYSFFWDAKPSRATLLTKANKFRTIMEAAYWNPIQNRVGNIPPGSPAWDACYFYGPVTSGNLTSGTQLYRQTNPIPFPDKGPDVVHDRVTKKRCSIM